MGKLVSIVIDSYNYEAALLMFANDPEIHNKIVENGKTGGFTIFRPDSGEPSEVVLNCLRILDKHFGHTVNAKGFRVLNNVRVIQGDGINHTSIRSILFVADMAGYSADNIAFGQGGALLGSPQRDDMKFAMKASAVGIRNSEGVLEWRDVYKQPITDPGKDSKKGKVKLWKCGSEYASSVTKPTSWVDNGFDWKEVLEEAFKDGQLMRDVTFDEVRANARL